MVPLFSPFAMPLRISIRSNRGQIGREDQFYRSKHFSLHIDSSVLYSSLADDIQSTIKY
jgi:hypothetical protein